jgi:hypothetical protein
MDMVQRVIARVGTTTAVILALAGLPNLAQATDHTTGHQVGKVAAFAEICGYGSRARQIHNRYSEMADFADGYAYWRQYLGKYDSVRTQCGQIKDISDQLISLNPRDLRAQEPVEKATPEIFDGRWIFEIADTSNLSSPDRRVVEIRDNRFTTEILVNGWRGIIRGEVRAAMKCA